MPSDEQTLKEALRQWRDRLWDEVHAIDGPAKDRLVELGRDLDAALERGFCIHGDHEALPVTYYCGVCLAERLREHGLSLSLTPLEPIVEREELARPCPHCSAKPGEWCTYANDRPGDGPKAGDRRPELHFYR